MRSLWRKSANGSTDRVELIPGNAVSDKYSSGQGGGPSSSAVMVVASGGEAAGGAALHTSVEMSKSRGGAPSEGGPLSERSRVLRGGKNSKGLKRFGLPKGAFYLYIDDLYHTLLNMPRYRFLASFFTVYLVLYLFFSFFYLAIPEDCIGLPMTFGRAFWFSMWTASTIGYSGPLAPSPDCGGVNILVTIQIITAALIDTMLMSLVFSRFAAPMPRANAIRFSTNAVLARRQVASGPYWTLSFRVANIRKHTLLDPELMLLLAVPDHATNSTAAFKFLILPIDDPVTQITSLKLGLPSTVTHVVTARSPLYNLSLSDMEAQGMEILCFMSGIDPMTSNMLQARHAYRPVDVRMNEEFVGITVATNRQGRLGVDLSCFDDTITAQVGMGLRDESQPVLYPMPMEEGQTTEGVRQHMQELRQHTLRSLSGIAPGMHGLVSAHPGAGVDGIPEGPDSNGGTPQHQQQLRLQAGTPPKSGTAGGGGAVALVGSHHSKQPSWQQHPLQQGSSSGEVVVAGAPPRLGVQEWDDQVRALCQAVSMDAGAAPEVRQRAATLAAALLAAPGPVAAGPHEAPAAGPTGAASGAGAAAPPLPRSTGPPSFDMLA